MIEFKVNESKRLKFDISVAGVDPRDLKGSVRLMIDSIEYGFPITMDNGRVVAEIPALSEVVAKRLKDGETHTIRLDMIADETYTTPWEERAIIKSPIKIEAKMVSMEEVLENFKIRPKIKVSAVEEKVVKVHEEDEEEVEDEKVEQCVKKDKKKSKLAEKMRG